MTSSSAGRVHGSTKQTTDLIAAARHSGPSLVKIDRECETRSHGVAQDRSELSVRVEANPVPVLHSKSPNENKTHPGAIVRRSLFSRLWRGRAPENRKKNRQAGALFQHPRRIGAESLARRRKESAEYLGHEGFSRSPPDGRRRVRKKLAHCRK